MYDTYTVYNVCVHVCIYASLGYVIILLDGFHAWILRKILLKLCTQRYMHVHVTVTTVVADSNTIQQKYIHLLEVTR